MQIDALGQLKNILQWRQIAGFERGLDFFGAAIDYFDATVAALMLHDHRHGPPQQSCKDCRMLLSQRCEITLHASGALPQQFDQFPRELFVWVLRQSSIGNSDHAVASIFSPAQQACLHLAGEFVNLLFPPTVNTARVLALRTVVDALALLAQMDTTTLILIIVLVILLFGGGWYGRGRWY